MPTIIYPHCSCCSAVSSSSSLSSSSRPNDPCAGQGCQYDYYISSYSFSLKSFTNNICADCASLNSSFRLIHDRNDCFWHATGVNLCGIVCEFRFIVVGPGFFGVYTYILQLQRNDNGNTIIRWQGTSNDCLGASIPILSSFFNYCNGGGPDPLTITRTS